MKTKLFSIVATLIVASIISVQKTNAQNWLLGGNNTSQDTALGTKNLHSVKIISNNIERIHVDKGGNIGIGTGTPGFPLNFASSLGDKISLYGNTGAHYGFGILNHLFQVYTDNTTSDIAFGSGSSLAFGEVMRIKGNGNVGIGTTTPTLGKFVVEGVVGNTVGIFRGGSTSKGISLVADWPGVYFNSYFNGTQRALGTGFTGILNFDPATGNIDLGTSPTSGNAGDPVPSPARLLIDKNGNVGIGTTTPSNRLVVTDNTQQGPSAVINNLKNAPVFNDGLYITAGNNVQANGTAYDSWMINFQRPDGTQIGRIAQTGPTSVGYFTATTPGQQLKTNIQDTKYGLATLLKIGVKDFKDDNSQLMTGFIAQQLYDLYPFAVSKGDAAGRKASWMVDYSRLTPLLVKSVQELSSQNDSLKQSNQALNDKLNALSDKINQIENAMSQCCNSFSSNMQSANQSDSKISVAPRLDQNVPNPFNSSSSISYYIPSGFHNAQLMITDASGKILKTYAITQTGSGKQMISGGELANGMYQYSLLVDGKIIDTKKMVISK